LLFEGENDEEDGTYHPSNLEIIKEKIDLIEAKVQKMGGIQ
jgi:hypothetical protein